ncbi:methyltransferase domain-containing protein [Singulisphaera rosea]
MSANTATLSRLETLLPLLACPTCREALRLEHEQLACSGCNTQFPIFEDRPSFLPDAGNPPRVMPEGHISNQPPRNILDWMIWSEGWILNLGAGGTQTKLENCVEMEYSIFRNTDIVGDAHHLPFADDAFDSVVSFNTFEHLADPDRAAAEIYRVLKPGGKLIVHTAFLQPVHEPPYHFYNTTEYGLRRWFQSFDIESVSVSENFHPAHVLGWLVSEMLRAVETSQGRAARDQLAGSSLEFWREMWENPAQRSSPVWECLKKLPQDEQKRISAGFQLDAAKPLEPRDATTRP